MTECPNILETEAWLDGEAGARADEIAKHVALCPICKAHAETVRRLDFAAREASMSVAAPASLLERLDDLDAAKPAPVPVSRRRVFVGFAAAASVLAIGSVTLRRAESADLPMAVFGDFATHLDADRRLDLIEKNPQRVMDWFSPKVPFALPQLASLSELDLIGGRLCWLLDRRIAAFNFDWNDEALSLYVADARGLTCRNAALPNADEPPTTIVKDGLSGAFWRDGNLAHALVGQPKIETIERFSSLLHTFPPVMETDPERNPA